MLIKCLLQNSFVGEGLSVLCLLWVLFLFFRPCPFTVSSVQPTRSSRSTFFSHRQSQPLLTSARLVVEHATAAGRSRLMACPCYRTAELLFGPHMLKVNLSAWFLQFFPLPCFNRISVQRGVPIFCSANCAQIRSFNFSLS